MTISRTLENWNQILTIVRTLWLRIWSVDKIDLREEIEHALQFLEKKELIDIVNKIERRNHLFSLHFLMFFFFQFQKIRTLFIIKLAKLTTSITTHSTKTNDLLLHLQNLLIQLLTLTNSFIHICEIESQVAFSSRTKAIFTRVVFERDLARKISREALITETHREHTEWKATIDDTMTTNDIVSTNRHTQTRENEKVKNSRDEKSREEK